MNVERIRARLRGGFRPFAVITSSGDTFPVPHPEFIFVTQRAVIIVDNRGYPVDLEPLHIVGLQNLPRTGSGKRKRRRQPR